MSEANYSEASLERHEQKVDGYIWDAIPQKNVARMASLERLYFSILFRKKVGMTFQDWCGELRIVKAVELLRNSDHTIEEIARKLGFPSLGKFHGAFRMRTLKTPREFRKSVKASTQ